LIITVAPHKDICPQGNTYPIKADTITRNKRVHPVNHTFFKKKEPCKIPRNICAKTKKKIREAPLK